MKSETHLLLLLETMYFKSFENYISFNRLPIIRNCVSQNLEARHVPSFPPAEHYQINESKTHDRRVIGQTPIKREKKSVNRRGGVSSSFLGANDRRGNELPDVLKLSSIPLRGAPRATSEFEFGEIFTLQD